MVVARDNMIEQLGLSIYDEGYIGWNEEELWPGSDMTCLPEKKPFGFTLRKTYGDPRLLYIHAW